MDIYKNIGKTTANVNTEIYAVRPALTTTG
jgi:hypothetical protein